MGHESQTEPWLTPNDHVLLCWFRNRQASLRTGDERALKVLLVLVGAIFSAGIFPVAESLWHQNQSMYTFDMMLSLYVALGIFLLIAARNPSANRSLIAFAAWSCFAHSAVMAVTAFSKGAIAETCGGVAVLVSVDVALTVLAPAKPSGERVSAAVV